MDNPKVILNRYQYHLLNEVTLMKEKGIVIGHE